MIVSGSVADGSGGGIFSSGTLTLTDSVVSSNRSEGDGGGGGIHSDGPLFVFTSTIDNNAANHGDGGGIRSTQAAQISQSLVLENSSGKEGGGVFLAGGGVISSSTISQNQTVKSGGGVRVEGALVTITSSTIVENADNIDDGYPCLLYTSPSPRDQRGSRMPSSA